ncbi:MAG: hypothetical protein M1833_001752 [Piccolia ochrophora]|nr:MAG: hypothetical protein M1833_001752 [Piccolia ochrophora]
MPTLPPLDEVERLSGMVVRVLGGNPGKFTLQGTNTYLLGAPRSRRRLLIDTGEGFPSWTAALRRALANDDDPVVTDVLLTHHHADHVGGVGDVRDLMAERGEGEVRVWKFPSPEDGDAGLRPLRDGQVFRLDDDDDDDDDGGDDEGKGWSLRTIHCPGHTPDHAVFLLSPPPASSSPKDAASTTATASDPPILFSGDAILGHSTAVFTDLALYVGSLTALLADGVDRVGTRIYPAHGAVVADGVGKVEEYIAHRREREREVLSVLTDGNGNGEGEGGDKGWYTPREIVQVVYRHVDVGLHDAAERGVGLVLGKLEGEGRVTRGEGGRWAVGGGGRGNL